MRERFESDEQQTRARAYEEWFAEWFGDPPNFQKPPPSPLDLPQHPDQDGT